MCFLSKKQSILLILLCLSLLSSNLYAQQSKNKDFLLVKQHNKYGGNTFLLQTLLKGITSKYVYYDIDGKRMQEDVSFSTIQAISLGYNKRIIYYNLGSKIKEERYLLDTLARKRGVKKIVLYFDVLTHFITKKEQFFVNTELGYNQEFFTKKGVSTKLIWFYPHNKSGFSKIITEFNKTGIHKAKETRIYAKGIQKKDGRIQVTYFYTKKSKLYKIEWIYSRAFEEDTGYSKKIRYFILNPFYFRKETIHYLNHKDELITPIHIIDFPF